MQTVLVVDDDDSARGLLQLMLEIEGFTVHQAATARDALKIVAREPIEGHEGATADAPTQDCGLGRRTVAARVGKQQEGSPALFCARQHRDNRPSHVRSYDFG